MHIQTVGHHKRGESAAKMMKKKRKSIKESDYEIIGQIRQCEGKADLQSNVKRKHLKQREQCDDATMQKSNGVKCFENLFERFFKLSRVFRVETEKA